MKTSPSPLSRARRYLDHREHTRLLHLSRGGSTAHIVGDPPHLALSHPDGTGHLYPLPAPVGEIDTDHWDDIAHALLSRPGAHWYLRTLTPGADPTAYTAYAPHRLARTLTRHAYDRNHGYQTRWIVQGQMRLGAGTVIPLEFTPDPLPAPAAFAPHGWAPHSWALTPPSGRPVLRITATLNAHL